MKHWDDHKIIKGLNSNPSLPVKVRGTSMGLTISDGEYVWIAKVRTERLRLGDIVLCKGREGRSLTLHRIVFRKRGVKGMTYITKGDGHVSLDGWIGEDEIIGRVDRIEKVGCFVDLLTVRGRLCDILLSFYSHLIIPLNALSLMLKPCIMTANKTLTDTMTGFKRNIVSLFPKFLYLYLSFRVR